MAKAKRPPGQRGRDDLLTPTIHKVIIANLLEGLSYDDAAVLAGISDQTYRNWRQRGKQETAGKFRDLFDASQKARIELKRDLLRNVRAGGKDWVASMTLLERLWPDEFGRRDRIRQEHSGNVEVSVEWKGPKANGNGNAGAAS